MRARLATAVLLVPALVLMAPSVAVAGPGEPDGPPPISPVATTWLSPRLAELTFDDPLLDPPFAQTKVRVLVPRGYSGSAEPYPVVYLLHGAGDTYASWTDESAGQESLESFTADKNVVIVMPDAGRHQTAGWYSDWYNGGAGGSPAWETYHIDQLIPYIDRTFHVRAVRNGRIVAGLSMGGFGAMSYSARHPDLFVGAFAFSGALDTNYLGIIPGPLMQAQLPTGVWGPNSTQEVRWRGHNPTTLAGNLRDVALWFTTGRGVAGGPAQTQTSAVELAMEAGVAATNDSFNLALDRAGIAHTYEPYPVGGHVWWYWQDDFHRAWPVMQALFAANPPAPTVFDYRSIEPEFSVWGWDVAAHRDVTEFVYLTGVSAQGLTVRGSGRVDVTTPSGYHPMVRYSVTTTGTAGTSTQVVRADAHGRLHLTVDLGPSHMFQQYTAAQRTAEATHPQYWKTATVQIVAQER